MRPVLIVKTGSTVPNVQARRGDFDAWIMAGMGLPIEDAEVVRVDEGGVLPEPDAGGPRRAVVVTGSAAMVSEREPWSEATGAWLLRAVEAGMPMLAICYGHQLLAHALGAEVGNNPRGRSVGTVDVLPTAAASVDALLGPLLAPAPGAPPEAPAAPLHLPVSHLQSVLSLPPGATRLATTARDPNHAFTLGGRVWAVQFHPEFDADIVRGYIDAREDAIRSEGLDPDALREAARDTDHGRRLLQRFAELSL